MADNDELKEFLREIKDRVSSTDANTVVLVAKLEAMEDDVVALRKDVSEMKPRVGNMAITLSTVSDHVLALHQKFINEANRLGKRLFRLEAVKNGNGHVEIEEDEA